MSRYLPALVVIAVDHAFAASAFGQSACTTNYCISSRPVSYQTPPG